MVVLEKKIAGKRRDQDLCEDGIFSNEHFAAVIDGCSSRSLPLEGGRSSGRIAKDLLLQALQALRPDATRDEAFSCFNAAILRWYADHGLTDLMAKNPSRRCSAYIALVSKKRREVWVLGDCQALVNKQLYTIHKPIDSLMENMRALYIECELQNGRREQDIASSMEEIQNRMKMHMELQSKFQNAGLQTSYTYYVLDGFFTNMDAVQVVQLGPEQTEVVLASDGYPLLKDTLHATEEHLATLLSLDPLCFRENRSTKGMEQGNVSFDDRSYLRVLV